MDDQKLQFQNTPYNSTDGVIEQVDPLYLDLDGDTLLKWLKTTRTASQKYWNGKQHNIKERQERNFRYYLGDQLDDQYWRADEIRYVDNILFESLSIKKPIALSRLPDLIVAPGNDTQESKRVADSVTKIINNDIKKRENRQTLGVAYKHRPIFLAGVLKAVWNPERETWQFLFRNPMRMVFDHTCPTNNVRDMRYIAEQVRSTLKEMIMRFPEKEEEILKVAGVTDKNKQEKLASDVNYWETWFKWYKKGEGNKYKTVYGVAWDFQGSGEVLLDKITNPYWDYEGDTKFVSYKPGKTEEEISPEDAMSTLFEQMGMEQPVDIKDKQVFHNHFQTPQFPYYIMSYEQMGFGAYDATTDFEQSILQQDNVNKRGKQITQIADESRGKHLFSTLSGIKKKDIEEADLNNPNIALVLDGELGNAHSFIQKDQPTPALFQDQQHNTDRIYQKMGTNSTTRGEVKTDTATVAQIARESDYGRIDDEVEDTINAACEWQADWAMHFIKLFVSKEMMIKMLGKDGEFTFERINRDYIEDGMEVHVSASSTDKARRKNEAMEMARMQMIDPLTFFERMEQPNPGEMTRRLALWSDPATRSQYVAEYGINAGSPEQQAAALMGSSTSQAGAQAAGMTDSGIPPEQAATGVSPSPMGGSQAQSDIQMMMQGQQPVPPQPLDPAYVQEIAAFIQSQDFMSLPPEIQQGIEGYAQQLLQMSQGAQQQPTI